MTGNEKVESIVTADTQNILRCLPKIDELVELVKKQPKANDISPANILAAARETIQFYRNAILSSKINSLPENLHLEVLRVALDKQLFSLRPVINATGIILHTNLGRSFFSNAVGEHVKQIATSYSTLEYDIAEGKRGSRYSHVEGLLCRLTGCESALVVNNNAAAVLLVLTALCFNKEVIVSRGELVEIGGSFRVPEIMEQGGAILHEVGTTNKTHIADFDKAISDKTGALLKVHTSNYKIVGFTEEVPIEELAELAHSKNIPLIYDLGSGLLYKQFGTEMENVDEPTILEAMAGKADVVTFSGDKLLGCSQAGIIIGKKEYIDKLKRHPLNRALRIDKLCLAALEATLQLYLNPDKTRESIPVLAMIHASEEKMREKATQLCSLLDKSYCARIERTEVEVGGGSMPGKYLGSWAVSVEPESISVDVLQHRLRKWTIPIIAHISKNRLLLEMRTVSDEQLTIISQALSEIQKLG